MMHDAKDFLSLPAAADFLGVSLSTLRKVISRNKDFPILRISPQRIIVSREGLTQWASQHAGNAC